MKNNNKKASYVLILIVVLMLVAICGIFVSAGNVVSNATGGGTSSGGSGGIKLPAMCVHASSELSYEQDTYKYHTEVRTCDNCGKVTSEKTVYHNWAIGADKSTCKQCGEVCYHNSVNDYRVYGGPANGENNMHQMSTCCGICQAFYKSVTAPCQLEGGVCIYCERACQHNDTFVVDGDTMCNECGLVIVPFTIYYGLEESDRMEWVVSPA